MLLWRPIQHQPSDETWLFCFIVKRHRPECPVSPAVLEPRAQSLVGIAAKSNNVFGSKHSTSHQMICGFAALLGEGKRLNLLWPFGVSCWLLCLPPAVVTAAGGTFWRPERSRWWG